MSRPLVQVRSVDGESSTVVPLPAVFLSPIRLDVVQQVHTNMAKNARQAYGVNVNAGKNNAALSWGTGRAVSRIPRVTGSGTSRAGQGAFGNMCRGGRMFAPNKTWRRWHRKISKGQRRFATVSALAASAVPSLLFARGHRVESIAEVPLVVADDDIYTITKTRDAIALLEEIAAIDDVDRVKTSRKIRAGKGKARNRRHTQRRGPLIVYSREDSSIVQAFRNIPGIELCHVTRLNLLQLAPGGHIGRFIIWTQSAFAQLDDIFGTFTKESKQKNGWKLPQPKMTNTDLSRLFNSDEVQSALRPKVFQSTLRPRKKNPLKNFGVMVKLNPYALTQKRRAILAARATKDARQKTVHRKRAGDKFLNEVLLAPMVSADYYDQYDAGEQYVDIKFTSRVYSMTSSSSEEEEVAVVEE